jgi:serine/threonine protein kinase
MASSGKKAEEDEEVPTGRRMPVTREAEESPTDEDLAKTGHFEDATRRISLDRLVEESATDRKMPIGHDAEDPPTGRRMPVSQDVDPTGRSLSVADDGEAGSRPGDVLAGKYRVERVLGRGGMGVVVAAHHLQLEERVALKFLLPEAVKNPHAVARFVREARSAVKIKGEHVARVTDVGQLENGTPYIVMEYLEGVDLAAWLKHRGPLPIPLAVDFVLQACEAVADAHALGIVHRDLKPANMFCVKRSDGALSIKVLDFGISKVMTPGAPGHDLTGTTALVGTPYYMSPEQMHSAKTVDSRTDIWALGVILFELVTGRPPFDGETLPQLAIRIANEPAPPARALRADVPLGLDHVIANCLAKAREGRYPSVAELAIALKDFGSKQAKASVERVLGTLKRAGISGAILPPSGEYDSADLPSPSTPAVPSTAPSGRASLPTPLPPQTGASWARTGSRGGARSAPVLRSAAWIVVATVLVGLVVAVVLLARRSPPVAASAVMTGMTATPQAVASNRPPVGPASRPAPTPVTAASTAAVATSVPPTIAVSALPTAPATPAWANAPWVPAARAAPSTQSAPSSRPAASSVPAPSATASSAESQKL